ncbi:MAG: hypothetical protein K2X03_12810 [Bryobacteraceae bacterium]|nr:hypothetical protein [Bryobacteraceae bacterium]
MPTGSTAWCGAPAPPSFAGKAWFGAAAGKTWFDVADFEAGAERPFEPQGSRIEAGPSVYQPITVGRSLDGCSLGFLRELNNQSAPKAGAIVLVRAGGTSAEATPQLLIRFEALLGRASVGGTSGDRPRETVELRVVRISYTMELLDGRGVATTYCTSWDLTTAKAWDAGCAGVTNRLAMPQPPSLSLSSQAFAAR